MSQLTAVNAAMYGFGLARRDPLTFLGAWILLSVSVALFALIVVPAYAPIIEAAMNAPGDPTAVQSHVGQLMASVGVYTLVSLPITAVMLGALNRSLVFGGSQGWFLGMKLGMDEVRVLIVTVVGYILTNLPSTIVDVLSRVLMGGATSSGDPAAMAGIALLMFPLSLIGLGLAVWIGIRLSFAAPASVAEGRFVIFNSWSMTKGRFWKLFLGYLLLFLILIVAYLVMAAVVGGVIGLSGAAGGGESPDIAGMMSLTLGPMVTVSSIALGFVATFFSCAWYGVAAAGYLDWKGPQADAVAETF